MAYIRVKEVYNGIPVYQRQKTYKQEDYSMIDAEWINKAIEAIKSGLCNKLEKGNITIYACGNKVIRIDVKVN